MGGLGLFVFFDCMVHILGLFFAPIVLQPPLLPLTGRGGVSRTMIVLGNDFWELFYSVVPNNDTAHPRPAAKQEFFGF